MVGRKTGAIAGGIVIGGLIVGQVAGALVRNYFSDEREKILKRNDYKLAVFENEFKPKSDEIARLAEKRSGLELEIPQKEAELASLRSNIKEYTRTGEKPGKLVAASLALPSYVEERNEVNAKLVAKRARIKKRKDAIAQFKADKKDYEKKLVKKQKEIEKARKELKTAQTNRDARFAACEQNPPTIFSPYWSIAARAQYSEDNNKLFVGPEFAINPIPPILGLDLGFKVSLGYSDEAFTTKQGGIYAKRVIIPRRMFVEAGYGKGNETIAKEEYDTIRRILYTGTRREDFDFLAVEFGVDPLGIGHRTYIVLSFEKKGNEYIPAVKLQLGR